MSKLIAVVGSTGGQGGSVVNALLESGEYKVRGLTRNPSGDKAKALSSKGVEVVAADLNDQPSLVKAFEGAHAIFGVTDFFEPFGKVGPEEAMKVEYTQGTNIAKAAAKTKTLEHFIWSTLPDSKTISKGEFVVPHFDAKARVDELIKRDGELLKKTTFLFVGFYASNIFYPVFSPTLFKASGKYVWTVPISGSTPWSSGGDHSINTGRFVRAILKNPSKTRAGKYVFGNFRTTTTSEYLASWANAAKEGAQTEVVKISLADYNRLFPAWGDEMGLMLEFWEKAGDQSWTTVGKSDELLTPDQLGLTEKDLVGEVEAWKAMDFNAF